MNIPSDKEKGRKSLLVEVFEALDIEWKMILTLRDLVIDPNRVVQAYVKQEKTYVNPFRFLLIVSTAYYIISSLFVDWDQVGFWFVETFFTNNPDRSNTTLIKMVHVVKSIIVEYIGFYFAIFLFPMGIFLHLFTRKNGSNLRALLGYGFYNMGMAILLLLLVLPLGYIDYGVPMVTAYILSFFWSVKAKGILYNLIYKPLL